MPVHTPLPGVNDMTFFVLLLAYFIRRRLDTGNRLDPDVLWQHYLRKIDQASVAGKGARIWPGVLMIVVPALVLVLISHQLRLSPWSPLAHGLDLIVLVVLLGATGWRDRLDAYTEAWRRGDMQAAWHHMKDSLPGAHAGAANAPETLHLALCGRFMQVMFERYFLIIFWYLIGGIGVALMVRGVLALRDQWPQAEARDGFAVAVDGLAWLPVRLMSVSFGLAGDLAGWLKDGWIGVLSWSFRPQAVLMNAADAALTGYALEPNRFAQLHPDDWTDFGDRSLTAVRDLLNRTMFVWIGVLALLVIAGVLA